VEARNNGQEKIPVHIFPARLESGTIDTLAVEYSVTEKVKSFWQNLKPIYKDFEDTKKLKPVKVNERGEYFF
jgi:murein L,D-transpeptidase YafK